MSNAHVDQRKKDEPYLNSTKRVALQIFISLIEFVLMFIALTVILDYAKTGIVDVEHILETIKSMMKQDSVLVVAIIGFLPILILENIGIYFGLGTVPRMVFGIVRILMILVWFYVLMSNSNTIDLVQMSGLSSIQGIESLTVNLVPFFKLVSIILLASCIIPVAEFIGARKKHKEALARYKASKGQD